MPKKITRNGTHDIKILCSSEARLNLDLHVLDNWAKQWLVDFNPQKTEYMVISFRQNINPINLKFNSQNLNQ